ncbi:hypothetical protein Tco_1197776, partial [Tanacetum coccineum]
GLVASGGELSYCLRNLKYGGELLKRRVALYYQRFAYQRFEQERSTVFLLKGIEGAVQQGPGTWLESLADLSAEEKEDDSGRRNSQGYYVSVRALNDMRNIKMTMPRMQLNSKFVNNMLPEWSRFITEVKLNRGLKESNFDRCLGPTLKANEVMLMRTELCEGSVKPNNVPWH